MILTLHIVSAITSIVYAFYVYIDPSVKRLKISYSLITLTLLTGATVALSSHAALTTTCITGVAYLSVVLSGILLARRKLIKVPIHK